ncbi:hypothetical protein SERLA73DRAFT_53296 [Serpula lacrymans var. lacrymans S7.3]|uniref:General transcription and DNA repair factor IIH subunit TFB4 n=1 Tax=Serpula lacrymans var. lacrymans (strain S7.3) TaxID=936435 RepID=F8PUE8_SERL3|nr:hypothetical protein SERLA73DRAFT_53296 [Serpula lacrymans var. lacrymans S7.3]
MEKASHLSVILDLSPTQWHLSAQSSNQYPLSIHSFLSQLLAFLNAHIASKHENTLAVFGAFPGKSVMLYSSTDPVADDVPPADANSYSSFKVVDFTIVRSIMNEFDALGNLDEEPPCALVGALTKALCCKSISAHFHSPNAVEDPAVLPDPRILILSVSPDLSTSYIPIMNSIFSAQKLKVTIDVCKVYGPDAVFLQQAAHLTGGSYIFLERRDALLQYLTMSFLSPPALRQVLAVPKQDKIDFRAACFCHKNIVDVGFVCSVCLSSNHILFYVVKLWFTYMCTVFCQPVPVCSTCR